MGECRDMSCFIARGSTDGNSSVKRNTSTVMGLQYYVLCRVSKHHEDSFDPVHCSHGRAWLSMALSTMLDDFTLAPTHSLYIVHTHQIKDPRCFAFMDRIC